MLKTLLTISITAIVILFGISLVVNHPDSELITTASLDRLINEAISQSPLLVPDDTTLTCYRIYFPSDTLTANRPNAWQTKLIRRWGERSERNELLPQADWEWLYKEGKKIGIGVRVKKPKPPPLIPGRTAKVRPLLFPMCLYEYREESQDSLHFGRPVAMVY